MNTSTILFFVFFLFYTLSSSAQEFGGKDSEWIYNLNNRYGVSKVTYSKDTVIRNILFNKYSIETSRIFDSILDTIIEDQDPVYVANLDGLVLFTVDEEEIDTLANFNAVPGDSWSIRGRFSDDTFDIVIIDTFRIELNNHSLFSMSYRFRDRNGGSIIDTLIDQVGSVINFIIPYDVWGLSGGHSNIGGFVRCFSNDALGVVTFDKPYWINPLQPYFDFECERLVGTEAISNSDPVAIFPNPVSQELCIEGKAQGPLYIYNYSGELEFTLKDKRLRSNCYDVSTLVSGMYFLQTIDRVIRFVKVN